MSTSLATPIARFDYRVRIAASLLRSAPHREHLVVVGMVLTSAAAAWPVDDTPVMVPALLALAALIRHHLDGLDARRDALAAAGARPTDTLVIQIAGPLGATAIGVLAGIAAAIALGRPATHALVPLVMGGVAGLVVRRTWLGAPALGVAALAGLATAAVGGLWPTVLAAVPALAGTQAGLVHRDRLRQLGRRLITRSSA